MSEQFKIQVDVHFRYGKAFWRNLTPTVGTTYLFDTEAEAIKMRDICYSAPEHQGIARVVPVSTPETILTHNPQ